MSHSEFLNEMVIRLSDEMQPPHREVVSQGVVERYSMACWFRISNGVVPSLGPPGADPRAMVTREIRYLALHRLVSLRRRLQGLLQDSPEVSRGRRAYRLLYRSLAEEILLSGLKEEQVSPPGDRDGLTYSIKDASRWFEASRRVISVEDQPSPAQPAQIVCHVSAFARQDLTERFLVAFFTQASLPVSRPQGLFDRSSEYVMMSSPARRMRNRLYHEVVILPQALHAYDRYGQRAALDTVDLTSTPGFVHPPANVKVVGVMDDIHTNESSQEQAAGPAIEFGKAATSGEAESIHRAGLQARDDVRLVKAAIERALADDQALDEPFIRQAAQERLGYLAAHHAFGEGPGPTLESSTRIVRDLVEAYELLSNS